MLIDFGAQAKKRETTDTTIKLIYTVHGIKRRASSFNTDRVDHLYQDPHETGRRFIMRYGDLTDATNLIRIIQHIQPDEIYNLAAQSHVQVSFETAEYTANADALGLQDCLYLGNLDAKRDWGHARDYVRNPDQKRQIVQ